MRVSVGRLVTFLPLALGHEFKSHIRIWPQTKLWFSNSSGRLEALSIPWCINFTTLLCTKLKVPERKGESKKTNSHYLKKKKNHTGENKERKRKKSIFICKIFTAFVFRPLWIWGIFSPTPNLWREALSAFSTHLQYQEEQWTWHVLAEHEDTIK